MSRRGARWVGAAVTVALLALLVAVGLGVGRRAPAPAPKAPGAPWVLGYYPGYQRDTYPGDEIAWDRLTHIVVGAVSPTPTGDVDASFGLPSGEGRPWAADLVTKAHDHGRSALLMVGGADSRRLFAPATATEQGRGRLADALLREVDEGSFDGLDLDWEPLTGSDAEQLLALGLELRNRRPSITLTAPVGPVNRNSPSVAAGRARELAGVFDRLDVMTYGMDGNGWTGWRSWHTAALTGATRDTPMDVQSSVEAYLRAGVPPDRLGLGIGLFGACFRGVTGPGQTGARAVPGGDDTTLADAVIRRDYLAGERVRWDPAAQVPYLSSTVPFGPLGCTFLSYEDERSVRAKAEYAAAKGLGGVILWTLGEGHVREAPTGSRDPLLDVVGSVLIARS